jgi:Amidohydrolase
MLKQLDGILESVRTSGSIGELRFTKDQVLERSATEYFNQSCWVGASQPGPADAATRKVMGDDRFMWGSDYPHDEGTYPYTREHLRQVFPDAKPDEMRRILAGNAAKLYGFDLDKLAPLAAKVGPTVEEIARPLEQLPENPNGALLKGAGLAMT